MKRRNTCFDVHTYIHMYVRTYLYNLYNVHVCVCGGGVSVTKHYACQRLHAVTLGACTVHSVQLVKAAQAERKLGVS